MKRRHLAPGFLTDIEQPVTDKLQNIEALAYELYRRKPYDHITILPDFDMDGIMSGVLGFAGLAELGFHVSLFFPNPSDGYGFGKETIDRLLLEHPQTTVILTCDTGITCHEGVRYAKSRGITVFVTDHHLQVQKDLDEIQADITVNPMQVSETYPFPRICGAFVLWKVLDEYARKFGTSEDVEKIRTLRLFAGIGTVSDAMPLLSENRILVKDAISIARLLWESGSPSPMLQSLADETSVTPVYKKAFQGFRYACDEFSSQQKLKKLQDLNEDFFGFYLAPTFNSVKRLDLNTVSAFSVFFDPNDLAQRNAMNYLYKKNEERKQIVDDEFQRILSSTQPFAPYIYQSEASQGLVGLLAQKLRDKNDAPVVVLSTDTKGGHLHGSGRAPEWYPAVSRVGATCSAFAKFRGHEQAFGAEIKSDADLSALYDFLTKDVPPIRDAYSLTEKDAEKFDYLVSTQDQSADSDIDIPTFMEFLEGLETFAPFGKGFEKPVGKLTFDYYEAEWKRFGSNQQHLKAILPKGLEVLLWNYGSLQSKLEAGRDVQVDGGLEIQENWFTKKPEPVFKGTPSSIRPDSKFALNKAI